MLFLSQGILFAAVFLWSLIETDSCYLSNSLFLRIISAFLKINFSFLLAVFRGFISVRILLFWNFLIHELLVLVFNFLKPMLGEMNLFTLVCQFNHLWSCLPYFQNLEQVFCFFLALARFRPLNFCFCALLQKDETLIRYKLYLLLIHYLIWESHFDFKDFECEVLAR